MLIDGQRWLLSRSKRCDSRGLANCILRLPACLPACLSVSFSLTHTCSLSPFLPLSVSLCLAQVRAVSLEKLAPSTPKPKRGSYDGVRAGGILKAEWLEKHTNKAPAATAALIPWAAADGGEGALAKVIPSTLNPQPSTLNPQPSTLNPQPSTLNPTT